MGVVNTRILLPVLALFALSCAPHHPCWAPHGAPWGVHAIAGSMAGGCGPEQCTYKSRCYSSGAIRSDDGACQECSSGKWVSATGCVERGGCPMAGKPCPCPHAHEHHPGR